MIKLIIWSLLLLQLPWLSQCQDYDATKLHTFYSTFLNDSPVVSAYMVLEDQYLGYNENLFKIDAFLDHMNKLNNDSAAIQARQNAIKILGDLKNLNESIYHTEKGLLRQLKFFHIRKISDPDSYVLRNAYRRNQDILRQARKAQAVVTEFDQLYISCQKGIELLIKVFGNFHPLEYLNLPDKQAWYKENSWYFELCNRDGPYAKQVLATHIALNTKSHVMYRDALFLLFDTMVYALELSKVGEFNGQRAAPDKAQLGPIEQMLYESNKAGEEIEKGLETIKARSNRDPKNWKGVYNSLLHIIRNDDPDWNMAFLFLYQTDGIKVDDFLKNYRKGAVDALNGLILGPAKDYLHRYNSVYKYNLTQFSHEAHTDDFIQKYWITTEKIINAFETKATNYLVQYGKHNFKSTASFQNLFLAWMEFNRLNAKIQCHLKNNYWDFHRNEALKKSQQPLWRVFGGISKTLYEPCVHNNTDLVGTCTAGNHEICMPMKYTTEIMREMDEDEETADTFLKPDFVYRPIYLPNGTMLCQETESYAVPLSLCRCGFRLDCGQDLGKNLTCVLQPNDNFRKQCKGGIGYPCKTLPLGPGRHHESCVTGFCNMRLNSCEKDPTIYPLVYSGQHRINEF